MKEIAQRLTLKGFRSPQRPRVLASTVGASPAARASASLPGPRPRRVPGAFTVPQIAAALGVSLLGVPSDETWPEYYQPR